MGTFDISSYISVKVYNEIPVRILHIFSEILSFPGTIIIVPWGYFTSRVLEGVSGRLRIL